MGASEQPYLYDRPSTQTIAYPYSDFNPKAVTQASYSRLSTASTVQPKKEGPLINFNQHPDSYVIVAGNQPEHKPLPANTKKAIVAVRWVLFAWRIVQELCALGLLVATICIKGTDGAETYLLRIPQAWDSLITLYAIYHLIRPAKSRQAGSSASYFVFALIMDVALIPLYVYIALATSSNRELPVPQYKTSGDEVPGNWRWSSFFSTQAGTDILLLVTLIVAAVLAGLHLLTCGLDLYLIIVFRKIAKLPPDMNPLEDNLTSRRGAKHQYKNSNASFTHYNPILNEEEKNRLTQFSGVTGSTLNGSRTSLAQPSMDERRIPFGHSRNNSQASLAFSPHNPESARWSKHIYDGQQELYREAVASPGRSRYQVRPDGKLEVRSRHDSQSPSKTPRGSVIMDNTAPNSYLDTTPKRNSYHNSNGDEFERPKSSNSPDRFDSPRPASYLTARTGASSPAAPNAALTADTAKSEQKQQLLRDNWYVLEDSDNEDNEENKEIKPIVPPKSPRRSSVHDPIYPPRPQHDRHDSFDPAANRRSYQQQQHQPQHTTHQQLYPKPLGMHPPSPSLSPSPPRQQHDTDSNNLEVTRSLTMTSSIYSESAPSLQSSPGKKSKIYGDLAAATRGIRNSPAAAAQPRVISRSGADIADESVFYVRNRREVSGKVAEEGRGGGGGRGWR